MPESLETRLKNVAAQRRATRAQKPDQWDLTDMALAVRWGALCIIVISVFTPIDASVGSNLRRDIVGASILTIYGVARSLWPIRSDDRVQTLLTATSMEAALCTAVAFGTGEWSSPFLLMVGCSLLIAGLLGGIKALSVSITTVLALVFLGEVAGSLSWLKGIRSRVAVPKITELLVMGAVGSYVHRVFRNQDNRYNQIRWMNEVHALLLELYTIASEHPGVFTIEGAVNATVARLRDLLSAEVIVVILVDPTAKGAEQLWEVAYSEGVELSGQLRDSDLPATMQNRSGLVQPEVYEELVPGSGFHAESLSGLYAPVLARGSLIGLIALERRSPAKFAPEDGEVVKEMARHAGLAIENARSYVRLRRLGAEEERERIARELHDQVGQSLAAVAFNIDRISASLPPDTEAKLRPELDAVSTEVRTVNREVREKLAELRGGPTATLDLVLLLEEFLRQVEMRSKMQISCDLRLNRRLPEIVEREVWRIGCEAIRNAERHSGARHLTVLLHDDTTETLLEVCDDGFGIDRSQLLRPNAFGLIGMRERADLIKATLALDSTLGEGTTVRLRVPRR